jgi:tRNA(adenine34) deaminase
MFATNARHFDAGVTSCGRHVAARGTDAVPRSIRARRPRNRRAFEIPELDDTQISLAVCRAAKVRAMTKQDTVASDMALMRRCIALAQSAGSAGEYPFAAVIGRRGEFICESLNMVRSAQDVTRHAEMVAISSAQKNLQSTSLDECTIYSTIEPCAMCSYAIRESRIGRVIFGLRSPLMGGHSRWDILTDTGLSSRLPEVFAFPPDVLSGCLHREVEMVFQKRNPLIWEFVKLRKIFLDGRGDDRTRTLGARLASRVATWARVMVFDRLWRG